MKSLVFTEGLKRGCSTPPPKKYQNLLDKNTVLGYLAKLENNTWQRRIRMVPDERYTTMAKIMKAMAHPTRLFMLDKLHEREHCVNELQALIGADMSTVSKHLSVLSNAGIIEGRKTTIRCFTRLLCPCVLDAYYASWK